MTIRSSTYATDQRLLGEFPDAVALYEAWCWRHHAMRKLHDVASTIADDWTL